MNYQAILALLMAKFTGVRKDGLTQMARSLALHCADEDEAKALVEKLTDAQVNDFVKEYRAVVDKEVSDGNKKFEKTLKAKYNIKDEPETEPGGNKGNPNDSDPNNIAEMIKNAVAAAVEPLKNELSGYKANEVAKSRLQTLTDKLKDCKDETFKAQTLKDFTRMKFDTDDEFNEYLTEKEAAVKEANQAKANMDLEHSGAPFFTQKEESGVSKSVAEYIAAQKPEANQFSGKEV